MKIISFNKKEKMRWYNTPLKEASKCYSPIINYFFYDQSKWFLETWLSLLWLKCVLGLYGGKLFWC